MITVHIGLRKTATSWLQRYLFDANKELIGYAGKYEHFYPDWLLELHYLDDFAFDEKANQISKCISTLHDKNKKLFISSEAFTNTAVSYQQAYRLKRVIPNARIILVLRDPVDMILSHHHNDIQMGNAWARLNDRIDWNRTPMVIGKRKSIYLPDFYADELVDLYCELFGSNNVLVLEYNEFAEDINRFIVRISDFIGVELRVDSRDCLRRVNSTQHISSYKHRIISNTLKSLVAQDYRYPAAYSLPHAVTLDDKETIRC